MNAEETLAKLLDLFVARNGFDLDAAMDLAESLPESAADAATAAVAYANLAQRERDPFTRSRQIEKMARAMCDARRRLAR